MRFSIKMLIYKYTYRRSFIYLCLECLQIHMHMRGAAVCDFISLNLLFIVESF